MVTFGVGSVGAGGDESTVRVGGGVGRVTVGRGGGGCAGEVLSRGGCCLDAGSAMEVGRPTSNPSKTLPLTVGDETGALGNTESLRGADRVGAESAGTTLDTSSGA